MFAALTQTGIGTYAAYAAGAGLLLAAILTGWNRALRKRIVQRTAALEESEQRLRKLAENVRAGAAADVTERERTGNRERESERRFREMLEASIRLAAIVEFSDDAIIGKDLHSVITSWNQGAENIFGYAAGEMVGTSILCLNPTDRPVERKHVIERILAGEKVDHFETVRQTKAGRLIDISVAPSPIKDAAGAIIGVSIVARDITERKRVEVELGTAREQLRALVGRLHTVREEEAKRIARELHDDLGQHLTALNLKLAHLGMTLPDATPQQRDKLVRMQAIVDHTIEVVQKIAGELRLGQLDVFGLTAAIEWHLQEFSRRSAISCRIMRLDEVAHLTDEQNTVVFRIMQEALTNVVRHADATEVEISLRAEAAQLTLTVRDNGRGITPAELSNHKSIGLLGMGERAALVGGEVTITGDAGGGTTVRVRIPLDRPEAVAA